MKDKTKLDNTATLWVFDYWSFDIWCDEISTFSLRVRLATTQRRYA